MSVVLAEMIFRGHLFLRRPVWSHTPRRFGLLGGVPATRRCHRRSHRDLLADKRIAWGTCATSALTDTSGSLPLARLTGSLVDPRHASTLVELASVIDILF